jgi:hypothetical protein
MANKRLWPALTAYAGLAALAWLLLDDERFRWVVWIFLGGLAVLTFARARYDTTRS